MAIIARGADPFEEASLDEAYVDLSSLGGMTEAEVEQKPRGMSMAGVRAKP